MLYMDACCPEHKLSRDGRCLLILILVWKRDVYTERKHSTLELYLSLFSGCWKRISINSNNLRTKVFKRRFSLEKAMRFPCVDLPRHFKLTVYDHCLSRSVAVRNYFNVRRIILQKSKVSFIYLNEAWFSRTNSKKKSILNDKNGLWNQRLIEALSWCIKVSLRQQTVSSI